MRSSYNIINMLKLEVRFYVHSSMGKVYATLIDEDVAKLPEIIRQKHFSNIDKMRSLKQFGVTFKKVEDPLAKSCESFAAQILA